MGAAALAEFGYALPPANIEVLDGCDGWLAGPHDSESYPESWHAGPEGVPGVILRGHYELYANIRPSKSHPAVPSLVKDVDLVIVRENTEGFYPDRNMFSGNGEFMPTPDLALCVGKFSRPAARRIARAAFELAQIRRRHVTIVHKSNVIPVCFGLFLEECRAVAREHPDVVVDDFLLDAMAAHLVRRPQAFDVIVTENLFGDTLSDLASELTGSLGMAASINAGEKYAMAQAAHGSAPDIAGQGIANPLGNGDVRRHAAAVARGQTRRRHRGHRPRTPGGRAFLSAGLPAARSQACRGLAAWLVLLRRCALGVGATLMGGPYPLVAAGVRGENHDRNSIRPRERQRPIQWHAGCPAASGQDLRRQ